VGDVIDRLVAQVLLNPGLAMSLSEPGATLGTE